MEPTHSAGNGTQTHAAGSSAAGGHGSAERDLAIFLERFFRFGAEPSIETYLPLFHPDATLFDDGMERPITVAEIPASITATLALAQGYVMVPERWRMRERRVFVEARNEATIFGVPTAWRSVYRIDLLGDRVLRGRRYYDRAPLLAALDPAAPALPSLEPPPAVEEPPSALPVGHAGTTPHELVAACERGFGVGGWDEVAALFRDDGFLVAPRVPRPLGRAEFAPHRRLLAGPLGGARPEVRAWAGDSSLVLIEWETTLAAPSGAHVFGMVDRFDLADGRILAARTYFDAVALARHL